MWGGNGGALPSIRCQDGGSAVARDYAARYEGQALEGWRGQLVPVFKKMIEDQKHKIVGLTYPERTWWPDQRHQKYGGEPQNTKPYTIAYKTTDQVESGLLESPGRWNAQAPSKRAQPLRNRRLTGMPAWQHWKNIGF